MEVRLRAPIAIMEGRLLRAKRRRAQGARNDSLAHASADVCGNARIGERVAAEQRGRGREAGEP